MGPQWDSWMAVREILSNSIDEEESNVITETVDINPKEGYTRIYVQHHPEIAEVLNNWNKYFSFDRVDHLVEYEGNHIYPNMDAEKESLLLYRKGIQCYHQTGQKALYNYDLQKYGINESRVVDSTYGARTETCTFLCNHATLQIARNILGNGFKEIGYWEGSMEWYYYSINTLSQPWREAIGDKKIILRDVTGFFMEHMMDGKYYAVSREMCKAIQKAFPDVPVYGIGEDESDALIWKVQEQTPKMKYMLKKAQEFLDECKYSVNYPIEVVEFEKKEILGLAKNKKILLSTKVFDMGLKEVVTTIIEEETHLTTGYADETRELERYLFQQWCSALEERVGMFL